MEAGLGSTGRCLVRVQTKAKDLDALNRELMQELYQARLLNQTLARLLEEATQEDSPNGKAPLPEQEEAQEEAEEVEA